MTAFCFPQPPEIEHMIQSVAESVSTETAEVLDALDVLVSLAIDCPGASAATVAVAGEMLAASQRLRDLGRLLELTAR